MNRVIIYGILCVAGSLNAFYCTDKEMRKMSIVIAVANGLMAICSIPSNSKLID